MKKRSQVLEICLVALIAVFFMLYLVQQTIAATEFMSVRNGAQGHLANTMAIGSAAFTLGSGEGALFPAPPVDNDFHVVIDTEILNVSARTADTFTVTRAQEGTLAAEHAANSLVSLNVTAGYLTEIQDWCLGAESMWGGDNYLDVPYGGTGAGTLTGLIVGNGTSAFTTTANNSATWDTAYADRLKWNGSADGLNAATARTNLELVPGTNVQAYDAQLADVAAVTPAANTFMTGNGANLVMKNAADSRTALGIDLNDYVQFGQITCVSGAGDQAGIICSPYPIQAGDATNVGTIKWAIGDGNYVSINSTNANHLYTLATVGKTNNYFVTTNGTSFQSTSPSSAQTALGLEIGVNVQAYNAILAAIAAGTWTGAASITTLGTIGTGSWNATTIPLAKGGTGATTAADARTNLGLGILDSPQFAMPQVLSQNFLLYSNDTSPPHIYLYKSRGTSGSPLSAQNGDYLGYLDCFGQYGGAAPGTFYTASKITTDVYGTPGVFDMPGRVSIWTSADGTATPIPRLDVMPDGSTRLGRNGTTGDAGVLVWCDGTDPGNTASISYADAQKLDTIAGLAVTDNNFIVGNGSAWVAESGSTARTSLGLGTIATQASNSVAITGGSITGITDLAIADGGTGASTAAAACSNLGVGTEDSPTFSGLTVTGAAHFDKGTSASPGIYLEDDTNTGFYQPASGELGLSVEGVSSITYTQGPYSNTSENHYISANNYYPSYIRFFKTRSGTKVLDDDYVGYLSWNGFDETNYIPMAAISGEIDGTTGTNDMPGRIVMGVCPDGSSYVANALLISNTKYITAPGVYNRTTASGANVYVDSSGNLMRSTSSKKYKTNIKPLPDIQILAIEAKTYEHEGDLARINKNKIERIAHAERDKKNADETGTMEDKMNTAAELAAALADAQPETKAPEYFGLIAENVAAVDPRLAVYDENGQPDGVDYNAVVALLVEQVKKQAQQIDDLMKRVEKLEKK